jgi:hypothetical protein
LCNIVPVLEPVRCIKAIYEPPSTERAIVHFTDGARMPRSRLVAAIKMRRPIKPKEVVHHRNGDSLDDRLSNLEVFPGQGAHAAHHNQARPPISRAEHKYLARFPLDLWAMLCSAASENSRSVNGEIIQRLRRSFEPVYRR